MRRSAKAPWQARQAIRRWLAETHPVLPNALLIVSELVTNVIQHVPAGARRNWVKVRLGFANDVIRLEVTDPGTTTPEPLFQPLQQGSMQSSGRGLGLVTNLSLRCGTERTKSGHRVVWAELAAAGLARDALAEQLPSSQVM
ncbi:ATP-binding protein [Nonomuraea sp. NPDC059023]|uniref:ATP-binding protein n=1 Tax=unclassified Nonomuraea TaxID=2593643 RepID=UPI00369473A9